MTEQQQPQSPITTVRRQRSTRRRKGSRASFGSVRQLPSGRWQARYTDTRDNRHTAPHTFTSKKFAEDWLSTTRADMVRGVWQSPVLATVTLAEFATEHLCTRLDLAPKTRELYADSLSDWIDVRLALPPAAGRRQRVMNLGEYELGALSVAAVREWYAAALHAGSERARERAELARQREMRAASHDARGWAKTQGIAVAETGRLPQAVHRAWKAAGEVPACLVPAIDLPPMRAAKPGQASVARAYRFLHMVLEQAVAEGRLQSNPAAIAGAGQSKAAERLPATASEVSALAANMPERYRAAVHVAAWSGLRAGELFGLARRHVDLERGTIRVERAAVTSLRGVAPHLGTVKTDSSRRTIHLPPHVIEILQPHLDAFTGPGGDDLVFTDDRGRIVSRETRQRMFDRARKAIDRPDLRWHDLRHTGATLAAQAGASVRELQHRLGHATVRAAMIYQHTDTQRDRDLAQRLSLMAMEPTQDILPTTRSGATG